MIKVLNLYAGIGGNRKLWEDVEVTAVENNKEIAKVYGELFPEDEIRVYDAHKFLLENYMDFDFIWSSPPCPTHSDIRRCGVHKGQYEALYPDMKLYEEIILLKHFSNCPWVVENVRSYYKPLIKPIYLERHYFWSSFNIPLKKFKNDRIHNDIVGSKSVYGFNIKDTAIKDKRKVLRNLVYPELGKYVFDCAFKEYGLKQWDNFQKEDSK